MGKALSGLFTDLTVAICKGHFWSADKHILLGNFWPLWWQFLMPGPHSSAPGCLIILLVAFDDLWVFWAYIKDIEIIEMDC